MAQGSPLNLSSCSFSMLVSFRLSFMVNSLSPLGVVEILVPGPNSMCVFLIAFGPGREASSYAEWILPETGFRIGAAGAPLTQEAVGPRPLARSAILACLRKASALISLFKESASP